MRVAVRGDWDWVELGRLLREVSGGSVEVQFLPEVRAPELLVEDCRRADTDGWVALLVAAALVLDGVPSDLAVRRCSRSEFDALLVAETAAEAHPDSQGSWVEVAAGERLAGDLVLTVRLGEHPRQGKPMCVLQVDDLAGSSPWLQAIGVVVQEGARAVARLTPAGRLAAEGSGVRLVAEESGHPFGLAVARVPGPGERVVVVFSGEGGGLVTGELESIGDGRLHPAGWAGRQLLKLGGASCFGSWCFPSSAGS